MLHNKNVLASYTVSKIAAHPINSPAVRLTIPRCRHLPLLISYSDPEVKSQVMIISQCRLEQSAILVL